MTGSDEAGHDQAGNRDDGVKKLTVENWLDLDIPSSWWARMDRDGTMRRITKEEWGRDFLAPVLADVVPDEVRRMFEGAQGALLYGFFYYPLYALGEDQLYRVAEKAVKTKCIELGAPPKLRFAEAVDWLAEKGILEAEELRWWHLTRELRNITTHAEFQRVEPPGPVLGSMRQLAARINRLFGGSLES